MRNEMTYGRCLLVIVLGLCILMVARHSANLPTFARKIYEYKEGEEYRFVMEVSSSADTEEGRTSSSQSQELIVKIESIDEDVQGYSIRIKTLMVSTGHAYFLGMYGVEGPIQEQVIEGDRLTSMEGSYLTLFNLFTSTDWDERETEWDDLVDELDDQVGIRVTDESASNGVFMLYAKMDVSDLESDIDYDDDGDKDGYTGWISIKGEYDPKGVLSSSSSEIYMEFDRDNNMKQTYTIGRGDGPLLGDMSLLYVVVGVVASVATFALGLLLGRRGRSSIAHTEASTG